MVSVRYFFHLNFLFLFLLCSGLNGAKPLVEYSEEKSDEILLITPSSDLVALITLSKELTKGFVDLNDHLESLADLKQNQPFFLESRNELHDLSRRINEQKTGDLKSYGELIDIRLQLKLLGYSLKNKMEPIDAMLQDVSALDNKWMENKKNWTEWNQTVAAVQSEKVQSLMLRAEELIDEALKNISKKLELLVADKIVGSELETELYIKLSEVEDLIVESQARFILGETPTMITPSFFSQFDAQLFSGALVGFGELSLPNKSFFMSEFWVIFFQVILAGIIAWLVSYFRSAQEGNHEQKSFQQRPISVGIVVSIVSLSLFYGTYPPLWHILLMLIAWGAFSRLIVVVIPKGVRRQFVFWAILSTVFTNLFWYIKLPIPLNRIFILFLAMLGAYLAFLCAKDEKQKSGMKILVWGFNILAGLLLVIAALDFIGFAELSNVLFVSTIKIISFILIARLFVSLAKEGISWLIYHSPLKDSSLFISHGSALVTKTMKCIYLVTGAIVLIALLVTWRVFDTPLEAFQGISSLGISFGSYRLTVGMVIGAVLIIYGAYFVSWLVQILLRENIFQMVNLASDVSLSISTIIHYVIMTSSVLLVLLMMGFSLTNLTIIAGSLGIGVGLGLQEIVKNFAAGICVLFERPIRVGDTIEFNGGPCRVKRIGLRSTLIQTKSETEIVIPNNDLITNPLTNWTLSQKRFRLKFPVGVAYHSDVAEVMRIMKECGEGCQGVLTTSPAQVIFMEFGDSTLNFEMRVWISDVKKRRLIQSEINQNIERRFREAGITIAYPQLDVHIHQS